LANFAGLIAATGKRVGVIDTDILSPGIHVLLGMDESPMTWSLNDYLAGKCEIKQTAYDVTGKIGLTAGQIFLVPSSLKAGEIAKVLREGYDVGLLNDGFRNLIRELNLDVLMIDTHPGLNEETLLSIAVSDVLIIVLRPDHQDYHGTGVTVEIARKLNVPDMRLIVNNVPGSLDPQQVKAQVEHAYNTPVLAVFPHSNELMTLASSGVFALRYPDHSFTSLLKQAAAQIMA
jgi:MinD-like ATPase involved in chromosome partitioning or flagellar assembly